MPSRASSQALQVPVQSCGQLLRGSHRGSRPAAWPTCSSASSQALQLQLRSCGRALKRRHRSTQSAAWQQMQQPSCWLVRRRRLRWGDQPRRCPSAGMRAALGQHPQPGDRRWLHFACIGVLLSSVSAQCCRMSFNCSQQSALLLLQISAPAQAGVTGPANVTAAKHMLHCRRRLQSCTQGCASPAATSTSLRNKTGCRCRRMH